jgi:large subunit ribosomal protein L10
LKREDKGELIADLHQRMGQARVAILTRFTGLDVEKMTQLRRELRKAAVQYRVVKNTLFRLAVRETDKEVLNSHLEGPVGVAWSDGDPVAPARVLAKYAKEWPELKIMVAASEGKLWGPAEIQGWVSLPSLEELRAKILGLIQAPATSLARLLGAPATKVARLLQARSAQKEAVKDDLSGSKIHPQGEQNG